MSVKSEAVQVNNNIDGGNNDVLRGLMQSTLTLLAYVGSVLRTLADTVTTDVAGYGD
jgi:hypothetical protein